MKRQKPVCVHTNAYVCVTHRKRKDARLVVFISLGGKE